MKTLFDLKSCGGKKPRPRPSRGSAPINNPVWSYDFSAQTSFSRSDYADWAIHGFIGQPLEISLSPCSSLAGRQLAHEEVDWLMFALYIYSADRFSSRRPALYGGPSLWRRQIKVKIPVVDLVRWEKAKPSILSALSSLTDDDWAIEFVERSYYFKEEQQSYLTESSQQIRDWVCLFSGGLDSLAGVQELRNRVGGNGLMVSGWTHNRLHVAQKAITSKIAEQTKNAVGWLPLKYGFSHIFDNSSMESSQRARGWMHVAMGLAAAKIVNADLLDICENGIGAFNLPTDLSQTGSHNSRSVHPVFLSRMAKSAELILGRSFQIRQNALFETKGDLLRRTMTRNDLSLISSSFSCEIFPNYQSKKDQCGLCPSCLVRRASLHSAGIFDDGESYTWDVASKGLPARKQLGLIKMEAYVSRLSKRLEPNAASDSLIWEYPEAASFFDESADSLSMDYDTFLDKFTRLHRNFVGEWNCFAQSILGLRQTHSVAA